ncbi:hypothetical protein Q8791_00890 [Nocardiopsis sp. CT-R113]|uniref:Uncharacterized protein n=1 Tax=Nocardiopsis codii TaxID=3065942 RepID=A0ABU7K0J0_9ACTN|nr:hypothetical protein [Nocardiopsis sp. CT-R113]MEE2035778.1 hypothetical protein [Nocardiopsis sp. CT-R113]
MSLNDEAADIDALLPFLRPHGILDTDPLATRPWARTIGDGSLAPATA